MNDLLIIGGGPAGYRAAEMAAQGGLSVILFEENALGGVCLNEGCIPTKALLHAAKSGVDHAEAMKAKLKAVRTLTAGVGAAMKAAGVTVVKARGTAAGRSGDGYAVTANGETYTGQRLLIAAGSAPIMPESLAGPDVLSSREILSLDTVPQRLVVVGGGVIGLEMAQYFHAAGAEVTVLELLPGIGGGLDRDIAAALLKALRDKGLKIETEAKVLGVGRDALGAPLIEYMQYGQSFTIEADNVLLALGRRPVFDGLGLDSLSVETSPKGIPTDRFQQTNQPNVYAAGDVTGRMMLAHAAYRQAEVAVGHMLGHRDDPMRYDAVPAVLYTTPEAACVGLPEDAAEAAGHKTAAVCLPMAYSGRFVAESKPGAPGLCKVVAEKGTGRILGVHVLGPYASEIILAAAVMVEAGMTARRAKRIIFPHPTVGEMIRECLFRLDV